MCLFVVWNDDPTPTAHVTPQAYSFSQREAAMLPQNNTTVRDPGFHFSSYRINSFL